MPPGGLPLYKGRGGVANTSLRLYADDTTEYASDASPIVLQYVLNSDLSVLSRWFPKNCLQINAAKTQAVAIGPSLYEYEFHLNDKIVVTEDTLKILGVILDSKLNFKAQEYSLEKHAQRHRPCGDYASSFQRT